MDEHAGASRARRRARQPLLVESLEDRVLLSTGLATHATPPATPDEYAPAHGHVAVVGNPSSSGHPSQAPEPETDDATRRLTGPEDAHMIAEAIQQEYYGESTPAYAEQPPSYYAMMDAYAQRPRDPRSTLAEALNQDRSTIDAHFDAGEASARKAVPPPVHEMRGDDADVHPMLLSLAQPGHAILATPPTLIESDRRDLQDITSTQDAGDLAETRSAFSIVPTEAGQESAPRTGVPLAGFVPVDLQALRQSADRFFRWLGDLGELGGDAWFTAEKALWITVASAVALQYGQLWMNRSRRRSVAGLGPALELLTSPPRDEA